MSEKDVEHLIQSGFFLELLLLYVHILISSPLTSKPKTEEGTVINQLFQALFILCALFPDSLGEYASRVLQFSNILHSSGLLSMNSPCYRFFSTTNTNFDLLLWYLFLIHKEQKQHKTYKYQTLNRSLPPH